MEALLERLRGLFNSIEEKFLRKPSSCDENRRLTHFAVRQSDPLQKSYYSFDSIRDSESLINSTAREFMPRSRKRGMLQVDRVGDRRSKAILARNFLSKTGDRQKKENAPVKLH